MAKQFLFSLMICLCVAPFAVLRPAQAQGPQADIQALQAEADGQMYQDAGAVILRKDETVRVGPDGKSTRTFHVVGKVFDTKAATDYSQFQINFNSHYEDAHLDFARSVSASGLSANTHPDMVQVKTLRALSYYADQRILAFPIPALAPGALFEFQVTIKDKAQIIENNWFHAFSFRYSHSSYPPRLDPVRQSTISLIVSDGKDLAYRLHNSDASPTITSEATLPPSRTYRWDVKDMPAIVLENHMPCAIHELSPYLQLTTLSNWSELDRWAAQRMLSKAQVTPEISQKAEQIAGAARTRREKIEAIFNFIQRNVKPMSVDVNLGGLTPRPAGDVLRDLYGDCKDQATLFVSLLKALDIDAFPALVNTCSAVHQTKDFPTLDFNHAIVYLVDGDRELWLDTTLGVGQLTSVLAHNQGKTVFVINGSGGKMMQIPVSKAEDNTFHLALKFGLVAANPQISLNITATGVASDDTKSWFSSMSAPDRKEAVVRLYRQIGYKGDCSHAEFPSIDNPGAPLSVNAVFDLKDYVASGAQDKPFVYSGDMSAALFILGLNNPQSPETRKHDLDLRYRSSAVMEWLCSPSLAGMQPDRLEPQQTVENRFFVFQTSFSQEGENVKVTEQFRLKEQRIKKEDYKEFYDAMQSLLKKISWKVSFSVPLTGWQKFWKGVGKVLAPPAYYRPAY